MEERARERITEKKKLRERTQNARGTYGERTRNARGTQAGGTHGLDGETKKERTENVRGNAGIARTNRIQGRDHTGENTQKLITLP